MNSLTKMPTSRIARIISRIVGRMPRCWQTRHGDLLAEEPNAPGSQTFYLVRAGHIYREYRRNSSSLDDSLFTLTYDVIDGRLKEMMSEEVRGETRAHEPRTELDDLVPIADLPAAELKAAIAAFEELRTRTIDVGRDIVMAACEQPPDPQGRRWVFYLVNQSTEPIDHVRLERVGYGWGDASDERDIHASLGRLSPQAFIEVWRDDDDAAEIDTWLELSIIVVGGMRHLRYEFSKLYRRPLDAVPLVGKRGVVQRTS